VRIGKGAQIPDYARVGRERWRAEDDDDEEEEEEEESEEEKGELVCMVGTVADFSPTRKDPWQRLCWSPLASGGGGTSRRLG
jgi:hypothetical protein